MLVKRERRLGATVSEARDRGYRTDKRGRLVEWVVQVLRALDEAPRQGGGSTLTTGTCGKSSDGSREGVCGIRREWASTLECGRLGTGPMPKANIGTGGDAVNVLQEK